MSQVVTDASDVVCYGTDGRSIMSWWSRDLKSNLVRIHVAGDGLTISTGEHPKGFFRHLLDWTVHDVPMRSTGFHAWDKVQGFTRTRVYFAICPAVRLTMSDLPSSNSSARKPANLHEVTLWDWRKAAINRLVSLLMANGVQPLRKGGG